MNRLVIVGNGFDLAHGLKTSYTDFIDWYFCQAFKHFNNHGNYEDLLFNISRPFSAMKSDFKQIPKTNSEVFSLLSSNEYQNYSITSKLLITLKEELEDRKWVDIERRYFGLLTAYFDNTNISRKAILELNQHFQFIVEKLEEYMLEVGAKLSGYGQLAEPFFRTKLATRFHDTIDGTKTIVLNFNYTDTVAFLKYASPGKIIHIHGKADRMRNNPIIFGYGDITNPHYQKIEDSGENLYLEHIKSFAYFRSNNYQRLLSYIDAGSFEVCIIGHSCGLSDRVLLSTIFQHRHCGKIEVYFHKRNDGSDNYTEITQELSRHFKPENKESFARKVQPFDPDNVIPQRFL